MSNKLATILLSLALVSPASQAVANLVNSTSAGANVILDQGNVCSNGVPIVEVIRKGDRRNPVQPPYVAPAVAQSSYKEDSTIPLSLLIGGGAGLVGLGMGAGFALATKKAADEQKADELLGDFDNEDGI